MSKRIPVGPFPHYYAIVDDEDYEYLNEFTWYAAVRERSNTVYAYRRIQDTPEGESTYMHKLLTGYDQTDHINKIGLDNRRENLRPTSIGGDANRDKVQSWVGKKPSSKYKGVCFDKWAGKWKANITVNNKPTHLGRFDLEEDAARAYDAAATSYFGEFAHLNFQEED